MKYWTVSVIAALLLTATIAAPQGSRRSVPFSPSLHIDANTVLCIAERGVQPTAKPVAKMGKRPAGIAVYGVSSLGVGVADGDVLTEVLGQPVHSQAQVIAMVIAARSASMGAIWAKLWRGKRSYTLTVEQPYVVPQCSADDENCWRSHCSNGAGSPSGGTKRLRPGTRR